MILNLNATEQLSRNSKPIKDNDLREIPVSTIEDFSDEHKCNY